MDTLTRVMQDAADGAPTTLDAGAEEWVSTSWRSGRRRRAVRGVAAGAGLAAAAALVVSLVVSGVGGMPSASVPADGSSRSARDGVSSYPQRIGHQWWVRDLPAAPGPVAGVVQTYTDAGDDPMPSWDAVTPGGTRYRLAMDRGSTDVFPALSPDGTRVGWLAAGGAYRIQDVVTGTVQSYDQLGRGAIVPASATEYQDGRPYGVQGQTPGFFSPSGDALALVAHGAPSRGWDGVLVLQEDGSTIEVSGLGQPAGWLDDDRLVGRTVVEETVAQAQQGDSGLDLVVWDRRTRATTPLVRVELPAPAPRTVIDVFGQFWGSLRSDGTLWVTYATSVPDGSVTENQRLVGYALPSGRPVGIDGRPVTSPQPLTLDRDSELVNAQRFWRGATPLAGTDGEVTAVVPAVLPGAPLVVLDPSADATQVIWAQDAIDGSPSFSPFGTWAFLPLWWWKEIALAALALGALRWWQLRRRRASRVGVLEGS